MEPSKLGRDYPEKGDTFNRQMETQRVEVFVSTNTSYKWSCTDRSPGLRTEGSPEHPREFEGRDRPLEAPQQERVLGNYRG